VRLWWDETQNKGFWIGGILSVLVTVSVFVLVLRKRSDPLEVSKKFFVRAGFKKMESLPGDLLLLHAGKGRLPAMVSIWQEGKSTSELFNAVDKYAGKPDGKINLYLVYSRQKPPSKVIQTLRQERCEVIPIFSSRLERALSTQNDEGILKELKELEDPFLTRTDPYAEFKPINDPNWFYGRVELMKRLSPVLAQGQHVGVFGLRKVGKTSLVKQIQQRFTTTPTVFVDCQAFSPKAEIYFEEILKQLHAELRAHQIKGLPSVQPIPNAEGFRKQFLDLFDLWQKSGQQDPFLIILDEIDKFFPNMELKDSEIILTEYVRFFKILRSLAQSFQCLVTLVIAYRPDVNRRNLLFPTVGENPMFKSFQEEYLGFLKPSESADMVQQIGLWKDIIWEEDATHRVFYYCGGHPLVTRYFTSLACEQGDLKHIDYEQAENTAETIRKSFHRNDIGNYYKQGVWALMHEDEKAVLSLICHGDEQKIPETQIPPELDDALTNLENFGLVTNNNSLLCLTSQLFNLWMKRKLGI
jgi:hypothetical protein